jgi:hypothetical protein
VGSGQWAVGSGQCAVSSMPVILSGAKNPGSCLPFPVAHRRAAEKIWAFAPCPGADHYPYLRVDIGNSAQKHKPVPWSLSDNPVCMSFRGAVGDEESRIALKTLTARFLSVG